MLKAFSLFPTLSKTAGTSVRWRSNYTNVPAQFHKVYQSHQKDAGDGEFTLNYSHLEFNGKNIVLLGERDFATSLENNFAKIAIYLFDAVGFSDLFYFEEDAADTRDKSVAHILENKVSFLDIYDIIKKAHCSNKLEKIRAEALDPNNIEAKAKLMLIKEYGMDLEPTAFGRWLYVFRKDFPHAEKMIITPLEIDSPPVLTLQANIQEMKTLFQEIINEEHPDKSTDFSQWLSWRKFIDSMRKNPSKETHSYFKQFFSEEALMKAHTANKAVEFLQEPQVNNAIILIPKREVPLITKILIKDYNAKLVNEVVEGEDNDYEGYNGPPIVR